MADNITGRTPCKECPFLKTAPAGWLGGCTDPDAYVRDLEHGEITCHMAFNKSMSELTCDAGPDTTPCIGALQMCNNALMFPRAARVKDAAGVVYNVHLDQAGKNDDVFKWKHEFIKHHNRETEV